MGSVDVNPKPWVPYLNSKDCSQGFCSLYCPQWCYIIFPPPPPIELPNENQGPNFSPLVIAIIGILASAFLLVSYYAIISNYCTNTNSSTRRDNNNNYSDEELANEDLMSLEPWHEANNGLDESLIKSITICKYKRGRGLIDDCSVCLSEFEEDESVKLLPKCSHAFHVTCIDTWLRSHSNCPLCRANIISINSNPMPLPPSISETLTNIESSLEEVQNEVVIDVETSTTKEEDDLHKDIVIEIRDEGYRPIRRSVSMDFDCRPSINDVLLLNRDEDFQVQVQNDVGSLKGTIVERNEISDTIRGLRRLNSHVLMKRSFSSGTWTNWEGKKC